MPWTELTALLLVATAMSFTPGPNTAPATADPARFELGCFKAVVLQFVNIKAWMNALLISAGWVTRADPMGPRLAVVLPLMMADGLASKFTYAPAGSVLRGWLQQGTRRRTFNRMLACVLVVTALWMARL